MKNMKERNKKGMKKFELTTDTKMNLGRKLFRIKALVSFGDVKEGTLGGYVEKEENLDHEGNAWVYDDAWVCDNAEVCGNAEVYGNAMVCDNAWVSDNADYATVKGFGTQCRETTFFRCKDRKIRVVCGCFKGTIEDFRKQVKATRTGKIEKEYLMIADLMELHFEKDESEE